VPTTLKGIRSGSAISTRQSEAQKPFFGMLSAMKMPSGTWISSTMAENRICRPSASHMRSLCSRSSNQ
jgi:hypothetical protein